MGDSGPLLSLEPALESKEGVEDEPEGGPTPKIGFIRGRFRLGDLSSDSWWDARNRLPNGEFLRPDIVNTGETCKDKRVLRVA